VPLIARLRLINGLTERKDGRPTGTGGSDEQEVTYGGGVLARNGGEGEGGRGGARKPTRRISRGRERGSPKLHRITSTALLPLPLSLPRDDVTRRDVMRQLTSLSARERMRI